MKRNWLGGTLGWLWLLVVLLPIYFVLITSFKSMAAYFGSNPVVPAIPPVIENFIAVLEADFGMYLVNSVVVAVGTVVPMVIMSFMASYSIVRGHRRLFTPVRNLFLLGLAIPVQATIVPIYLIIIRLHMYDSLAALMLPGIAFGLPLSILIIANSMRDVPKELFEAMDIDGCTEWQKMWRLALPMTSPALVTVAVYQALLSWNGFLFPLILTQSPDKRTLPLALWSFQGEYATNIPVVMAAVTLSSIPIVILYAVGRRYLVSGMTAGAGK
ncbi:ABC transporter permease [Brachybacterium sp. P6-10-X1]|uniref:carbohydrate ABC transporter permease n=1 Tax=Brachybacterium sp. P6-10-X1 TaxID=1903186 RepID=UPI000971A54C|nr:carbohydrate ABC transporter permease [Brachybacterium sp. P6-10-X1]APX33671.1 ABC transporter permease [Brachybacterium sp. P6-10-X1]